MKKLIVLLVGVLVMCQTGYAAVDNDLWQNEYTVNSHTVGLLHFNTVEVVTDGHMSKEEVQSPGTKWAAVTLDTADVNASGAHFVSGGKFGGGLENTGADTYKDRAVLNDSKDLMPSGEDVSFSVECWVKFDALGDYQWICDSRTCWTTNEGYALYVYPNGELHFSLAVGDGSSEIGTFGNYSEGIDLGTWYHVAGVWDAADDAARLYVNDEMIGENIYTDKEIDGDLGSAYDVVLMNRCSSTQKSLDGVIDEFMVSDVAYNYIPEPATMILLALGGILVRPRNRK